MTSQDPSSKSKYEKRAGNEAKCKGLNFNPKNHKNKQPVFKRKNNLHVVTIKDKKEDT